MIKLHLTDYREADTFTLTGQAPSGWTVSYPGPLGRVQVERFDDLKSAQDRVAFLKGNK